MPNTTVQAAGEAMPTHILIPANLRRLNMKDLDTVHNIFSTIRDVAMGLVNQPRCQNDGNLSPAGDEVDDLLNHLSECVSLVVNVARDAAPEEPNEVEERAWLILAAGANCTEHLGDFSALAASLAADHSHAEFHARHGGRS